MHHHKNDVFNVLCKIDSTQMNDSQAIVIGLLTKSNLKIGLFVRFNEHFVATIYPKNRRNLINTLVNRYNMMARTIWS